MQEKKKITNEVINTFINGHGDFKGIVNVDCGYQEQQLKITYRNEKDEKCIHYEPFYPFLWAKRSICVKMCDGDHKKLKMLMFQYGINVKLLDTTDSEGKIVDCMRDGYCFLFYATKAMSQQTFNTFFSKTGCPIKVTDPNSKDGRKVTRDEYLTVSASDQYLIKSGNRFFKGMDEYDDILRMIFDLETEGLDPHINRITQIGIRFNRPFPKRPNGFEKILSIEGETEEEKNINELKAIETFFKIIYTFQPDVITGHNSENFDWVFIIERCRQLGTSIEAVTSKYFNGETVHKEDFQSSLKLGGEVESFYKTIVPGIIVTDSMHAVRRAQATDSNFLRHDLKYSTNYLGLKKTNRVYTPGSDIAKIWSDTEHQYAFNNTDGDWYIYDPTSKNGEKDIFKKGKENDKPFIAYTRNFIAEGYELTTGRYIVERYLLDDLWECDKVEEKLNTAAFSITKLLPLTFSKCCTMGTAGQWKALMMAWSYENNLAIPSSEGSKMQIGGLSRLLSTGYIDNVIKLDYNSLYPSIILTWGIKTEKDTTNAMLSFLEYMLTSREYYKGLKKAAGKVVDKMEEKLNSGESLTPEEDAEYKQALADYSFNDKNQNSRKIFCNSFFGALGAQNSSIYPWSDVSCAERTTCTGRQSLRLMISHFATLGKELGEEYNYKPIVGDSFTPDTPVFIKYNDSGLIDIKPISELIDESSIEIDELGREYDYGKKSFKVLCRSGWVEPSYIYRHKTDKDLYEISEGDMKVEVTEDHSLFNIDNVKIKPSEINKDTKLEYYKGIIKGDGPLTCDARNPEYYAEKVASGEIDRVPMWFLNRADTSFAKKFYYAFMENSKDNIIYSKTCLAGLQYIKEHLN